MYRKKGSKQNKIVILVIVAFLFLLVIGINMLHNRDLNFVEKAFKDAEVFVAKVVYAPVGFVKEQISNMKSKDALLKENKKLKKNTKQIDYNKAKIDELENEVKRLKEELELDKTLGEKTALHATTINRHIDGFYQSLNIDKGKKNGVVEGMPVINSAGLIGVVSKTGNYSSTVSLLTSDTFDQISVRIKVEDQYIYGLLSGYKQKKNVFILEGIAENIDIPKEAVVTTTGMGKTFPAGLLVGKVKKVTTDNFDLAKIVEVTPAANFHEIDYVSIVKRDVNYD